MERWSGRVALVTGASAGIGAAIVKDLVRKGMKVVGVARRVDRVEAMKEELKGSPGQLHPLKCDVSSESDIVATFKWISENLGGVDVLVNNAGIGRIDSGLIDGKFKQIQDVINVNVLGLTYCTRLAVQSMREREVAGHIIHINSVAGHKVLNLPFPGCGIYTASKHAVTALTDCLRNDLVNIKSQIRVTSISPGYVKTEMAQASGLPDSSQQEFMENNHALEAADIADAVAYVLGTPPHVQIHELTIRPVGEVY